MKILWLDINSSYSHSSVALPAIHAQVQDKKEWEWCVVRGTINDNPGTLAAAVAAHQPDVIAATFWLFTHQMQIEILSRTAELLKDTTIVCGGPEFLGDNESFLRRHRFVSAVIRGEGEIALPEFLTSLNRLEDWKSIEGLCWIDRNDSSYHDNGTARVADFAALRYPEESSFFNWDKPFVQLETTRGCFNTCAFCVSGGEKPVRHQSTEQVKSRLANIYEHGIKDVRVLDRTFNYDIVRACEMLDIFSQYEGHMRFHLEIHPSLISDTLKDRMSTLPKGLLHLETGIQSLDSQVLSESGRKGSIESSVKGLEYLSGLENIETHADLIVGLPGYSLEMLCKDIIRLISIGVDELQIESLKVLPGTQMRHQAKAKELIFSPLPPYEIMKTPAMTYQEIVTGMDISRMVDLYYNCKPWQNPIRELICRNADFLTEFTGHLKNLMILDSPVSLERRGVILYEYCIDRYPDLADVISIEWIKAGCSLKKKPAGNLQKIKNLETFLEENRYKISISFGVMQPSHRYYLFTSKSRKAIFGYDSETQHHGPVFMAIPLQLA